jgi:hypothetical protein
MGAWGHGGMGAWGHGGMDSSIQQVSHSKAFKCCENLLNNTCPLYGPYLYVLNPKRKTEVSLFIRRTVGSKHAVTVRASTCMRTGAYRARRIEEFAELAI